MKELDLIAAALSAAAGAVSGPPERARRLHLDQLRERGRRLAEAEQAARAPIQAMPRHFQTAFEALGYAPPSGAGDPMAPLRALARQQDETTLAMMRWEVW